MKNIKTMIFGSASMLAFLASAVPAYASDDKSAENQGTVAANSDDNRSSETIVVTARRVAEDIQKVPVAVTALGSEQLRAAGITKVTEIAAVVPGLNLFFNGNASNTIYSIRGMARGSLGFQQPAVTTYVNDVPTTTYGAGMPTYDLANIQVLKGPQGTLFGRNSEAGAILTNTRQPSYDANGYAAILLGDYSWTKTEGAVNIPLIDNKLAIRVAGVFNRRDGYTKNLSFPGNDFANIHNQSFRASVLVEPIDNLKNVFVYEKYDASSNGVGTRLLSYDPTSLGLGSAPDPFGIQAAFNAQQAAGPRTTTAPYLMPTIDKRTRITNTTTLDLGGITVKNVFGYSKEFGSTWVNQVGYDFPLISGHQFISYKQITDELQFSGKALDDNLTYIFGGFYLDYHPDGRSYVLVAPPGTFDLETTPFGASNYYRDKNKSAYGQINYKLGGLSSALEGVSIDAGVRYSKDDHSLCSIGGQTPLTAVSESTCLATPANRVSASDDFWSYTFGLNYQVTNDLLLYATTRRGYRAGGINAPILGGSFVPYQSFKPEKVNDYELGIKSHFELGSVPVTFNAAIFQADYSNLQFAVSTTGPDVFVPGQADGDGNPSNNPVALFYANVGEGRVKGLEAALTIEPLDGLRMSGGLSILDKKVTKDSFVAPANWAAFPFLIPGVPSFEATVFYGSPDLSYNGSIDYTLPTPSDWGEMIARVQVNGSGKVQYDGITVPAKALLNLRFDWNSVMGSDIDLSAFVTNVTDKLFVATPALSAPGSFAFTSGTYNEPRMFGFEARWHFGAR